MSDSGVSAESGSGANISFTEREMQMLAWAMQSLKSGPPEIDYEKLAGYAGMSNPRSASNAWAKIKNKLQSTCPVDGATPALTPKKPRAQKTNEDGTPKNPRKRAAKEVDGEGSPKKKGRGPAKKKGTSMSEEEASAEVKNEAEAEAEDEVQDDLTPFKEDGVEV